MHLEVLVEDQSGMKMLNILIPMIIGEDQDHTFNIHSYKGIGHIPKNISNAKNASTQMLLQNLPRLLRGYGNTFAGYPNTYKAAVILVCDLDDKNLGTFLQELKGIWNTCIHKPLTHFCIAIEEGEAWLLGDLNAIKLAYPKAKDGVLNTYLNDSICGTWEKLADAIYPGGSHKLNSKGWQAVGEEKSQWAENITPHIEIMSNKSPSFCHFLDKIKVLVAN